MDEEVDGFLHLADLRYWPCSIEGLGPKRIESLSDAGIESVGGPAEAGPPDVARAIRDFGVTEETIRKWIGGRESSQAWRLGPWAVEKLELRTVL